MSRETMALLYWLFFAFGTVATGVGAALPAAIAVKITMGAGGALLAISAELRRRMEPK